MKFTRWDIALIVTGIALVVPLAASWMMHLSPVLSLFGVMMVCVTVIVRMCFLLRESFDREPVQQTTVSVSSVPQTRRRIMQGQQQYARIAGAALPPPQQSGLVGWVQEKWGGLWESKKHGLILLCAALWVVCPLDGDIVPFLGWVDDGFALVLGAKHLLDMFKRDVSSAHTSMLGAIDRAKLRDAMPDDENVIDADNVHA